MGVGSLFPFCRGHSEAGTTDHEPWSFGEEVNINILAFSNSLYAVHLSEFYDEISYRYITWSKIMKALYWAQLLAWYQHNNFSWLIKKDIISYSISCFKFWWCTFVINLFCVYFKKLAIFSSSMELDIHWMCVCVCVYNSFIISRTDDINKYDTHHVIFFRAFTVVFCYWPNQDFVLLMLICY